MRCSSALARNCHTLLAKSDPRHRYVLVPGLDAHRSATPDCHTAIRGVVTDSGWRVSSILANMEVRFTPEIQAQLNQLGARAGKDAEYIVQDIVRRLIYHDDAIFAILKKQSGDELPSAPDRK